MYSTTDFVLFYESDALVAMQHYFTFRGLDLDNSRILSVGIMCLTAISESFSVHVHNNCAVNYYGYGGRSLSMSLCCVARLRRPEPVYRCVVLPGYGGLSLSIAVLCCQVTEA